MNATTPDLVELPWENLRGTQGKLRYLEYSLEFNGAFDGAGKPILNRQQNRNVAPIVRPNSELSFQGLWVPHERIPFVVLDTGILKLGFATGGELLGESPLTKDARLFVEAIEVPAPNNKRRLAWAIYQMSDNDALHCLNPAFRKTALPISFHDSRVPREDAVRYLGEEIELLREQRKALNLPATEDPELCLDSAMLLTVPQVLGTEFRKMVSEKRKYLEDLRSFPKKAAKPTLVEQVRYLAMKAFAQSKSASWTSTDGKVKRAAGDPEFERIATERAERLICRNRGMVRRLAKLTELRASLIHQKTKVVQSTKASSNQSQPSNPTVAALKVQTPAPKQSTSGKPIRTKGASPKL